MYCIMYHTGNSKISKACRVGSEKQSTETSVDVIITAPCTVLHYHPYISSCSRCFCKTGL